MGSVENLPPAHRFVLLSPSLDRHREVHDGPKLNCVNVAEVKAKCVRKVADKRAQHDLKAHTRAKNVDEDHNLQGFLEACTSRLLAQLVVVFDFVFF